MGERSPRALDEVLGYLENLGFDHLYLQGDRSKPDLRSRSASERSGPADANLADANQPHSNQPHSNQPHSNQPGADLRNLEGAARLHELDRQRALAEGCTACELCRTRKNVVFSDGRPDADLMFVGEGPGAEEDRKGLPFVGPAGSLLNRIIQAIDLRREQVYIANMVKCRPPGNRDPVADELAACRPYLDAQIDLVRPKVIVALGRVAAQALLDSSDSLGRLRGRWHSVRGVPTLATYHPAALLRNEKWKRPTWEDMKTVRARLTEETGISR